VARYDRQIHRNEPNCPHISSVFYQCQITSKTN